MDIIKSFYNLMVAKGYGPLLIILLCLIALIFILRIVCWVFGVLSLPYICKKREVEAGLNPYLPCGQLRSTLMLTGKDHALRRSGHYIWWFFTCFCIAITAIIWYYNALRLQHSDITKTVLSAAIILAALAMLVLYFLLRRAEAMALRRLLKNKNERTVALIGMIFFVPLQRYFIYKHRRAIANKD
ncbi:MAG: hypothetical protein IJN82_00995 [Clostridia bacterium]|nr:hypothetical protein [Clostridia bacterium]MBQ7089675.1 hypothetical protein [Clostridia bacterium]